MSRKLFSLMLGVLQAGRCWPLLAVSLYAAVFIMGLRNYLVVASVGTVLGGMALYTTTSFRRSEKGRVRFFSFALIALSLYCLVPAKTLLCISCLCGCLFLAETFYGRINFLPVLVLIIMSPLFEYGMNVFSFPIRLALTSCAGRIIGMTGQEVLVEGNMITCNGNEFSVDPACMGLQMMVTALLCGMILIGFYQRQYKQVLNVWTVLLLLGGMILLNVMSNLLRIIFLVWMNIMPDAFMHDVVGIMCLVLYVIVPVLLLTPLIVRRFGIQEEWHRKRYVLRSALKLFGMNLLLPVMMLLAFIINMPRGVDNQVIQQLPATAGYKVAALPGNIIKLQSDSLLVYIKHIPASYYTEHNPMICWKGSGFDFYKVEERVVGRHTIYTALLQQDREQLYTAWWYDNGSVSTSSQMQWRWDVLLGAHPYSLVNVTAGTEKDLQSAVSKILKDRLFIAYL